ncbi:MAG: BMP family ABC transporter substrate-binding protein [Treponema sp.]|jgi:simple sugar transport system substrate-binding protein|nr:BMP family ABC transporter substrate-binding protein [Treponema sp.]
MKYWKIAGKIIVLCALCALCAGIAALFSCDKAKQASNAAGTAGAGAAGAVAADAGDVVIGVFIPGVMAGSATYEMLAQGVERAGKEKNVEVKVVEAGYNQAEWETILTSMAASGAYSLIVSSNPSLPAIAESVSAKFPKQKFLLLDGRLADNAVGVAAIYTVRYNQTEQAYMAGYIAALESRELGGTKVGLVAGQEYPAMNEIILPGYVHGAQAVDPSFTADFRVVGNWFDAGKAASLAQDMIARDAKAILCVAGGANEGVVQAAYESGAKVVWFDSNGYAIRPGTVVGSSVIRQDKLAYEKTLLFLEGSLPFGASDIVGVAEGYVDFIEDDPDYKAAVSEAVREKQADMIARIRNGSLVLQE